MYTKFTFDENGYYAMNKVFTLYLTSYLSGLYEKWTLRGLAMVTNALVTPSNANPVQRVHVFSYGIAMFVNE